MAKPIIVAVDPHREDFAPAALGTLFARVVRAPLVLAAAYPVPLPVDSLFSEYERSTELETEWALEHVADRLHESGVAIRTVALPVSGSPARALQPLAEREAAQLLVIGSSARGRVGRAMPGAVTDRLLHGAPCPVAVAPAGYAEPEALRVIGVAFTDTPDGQAALGFAETIATAAGAPVRVLSVAERLSGNATNALAAASQELDLLVCGSRGYGPVRTVLVGGTSHALVRKATCPVVVVPRTAVASRAEPQARSATA